MTRYETESISQPVYVDEHGGRLEACEDMATEQVHRHRVARTTYRLTDHCSCGAARPRLINGSHEEIGEWEP